MDSGIQGIVPVMLTPFDDRGEIDFFGLEKLTKWYLSHGVHALFAVCQSSEMQFLSRSERVDVANCVLSVTNGRVPVVASGHVSASTEEQIGEIAAIAQTGIDAFVLVTNRLDPKNSGEDAFRTNLATLLSAIPTDLRLGLYECPAPYRRLVSDDELKLCRDTGRFVTFKDVSCDLETVKRRVALTEGSPLAIVNANAAIAFDAMRHGSKGFAGVFTNFHPDLYVWLYNNKHHDDVLVRELTNFLALAAVAEGMGYPKLAKHYHCRLGTFPSSMSRAIDYELGERHWAVDELLDHIDSGTRYFRSRIASGTR